MSKKLIILLFLVTTACYSQAFNFGEMVSGVSTSLNSISYPWICGDSGVVLRTTNGSTWIKVSNDTLFNGVNLKNVNSTSSNSALVSGIKGAVACVFRTTNAGVNWSQVLIQPGGFINSIYMLTSANGYLIGNPVGGRWTLFKTTDGGINWDSAGCYLPQNGSEIGWKNSVAYANSKLMFGTNNSRIYASGNLSNWEIQNTIGEVNSSVIRFRTNSSEALLGGNGLLYTNNYGTNWVNPTNPLPGNGITTGITSFVIWWYVVRNSPDIFFGSWNGGNWSVAYTAPAGNYEHIWIDGSGNFYAVRSNGGITYGDFLLGVELVSSNTPFSFSLYQNYPNPFNPVTQIKFDIPKVSYVKLAVFDILGREVAVLVNGEMKPGVYNADWNASSFASGVYFYEIKTNDYRNVKKMILIK